MNKSDILSIARQQLSDAISNFQTPTCNPLQVSPWIAMSLLQKAIRRGRKNLALRAAGKRFCTCRLSAFRAMNVILQGDGSPYGVLEVDSRSEGEFSQNDIAFLQGAANILGMAIEQQQYQRKLQAALDRHQVLLREVNHRVKKQPAGSFQHASAPS
jgi:GAF domain-containing protein